MKFKALDYTEERGFVCGAGGGTTAGTDSTIVEKAQTDTTVRVDLTNAAQKFAPAICGAGLNLGLFGSCGNASVVSMDVNPSGHTGTITKP